METEIAGDVLIVTLPDRVDAARLKDIEGSFANHVAEHRGRVLVDMSKVDFMASLGLRMLLIQQKELQHKGSDLRLSGLQPQIADVFRKTRFDSMFTLYPDRDSALQAMAV